MASMPSSLIDLVKKLESGEPTERAAAAESLCQLEEGCQPACVALVRASSMDDATREWANAALESMGAPAATDIDSLCRMLSDPSSDVAYWAATLLGRLEEQGTAACDALVQVVGTGQDLNVRERAVWALQRIGCTSESVIEILEHAAKSQNARFARVAQQALDARASA